MTEATDEKLLKDALRTLGEYFDVVQIFTATNDGTIYQLGSGNIYARYGQAKAWVVGMESDMAQEMDDMEPLNGEPPMEDE